MSIRTFTILTILAATAACGQDPTSTALRVESGVDSTVGAPPDSGHAPPPDSGHAPPPDSGHAPPPDSGHAPPPDSGHAPPPDSGYAPPPDSAVGGGDTTVVTVGAITASRVSGGVRIVNGTSQAVAYAVWNPGWLALFAPCVDSGADCPRLASGATVTVPDRSIGGLDGGTTQAVVRWWLVLPDGAGGNRAGEVHEILVTL